MTPQAAPTDPHARPGPAKDQRTRPHCLMSPVLTDPVLLSRQSRYVIGREERAGLRIKSASVSRRHAEIHWTGEGFVLFDLGSTNGTYLNGWRLTRPCYLHDGDVIDVGTYEITVHVAAPGDLPDDFRGATRPMRRRIAG